METLFLIANLLALPGWVALFIGPRWPVGVRVVAPVVIPMLLAVFYAALIFSEPPPEGSSFATLEGVRILFTSDVALLAGWIHYLAFDLFIACWEVREGQRCGMPHGAVVPCLILTLMFGPLGLFVFLLVRGIWKKRWAVGEIGATPDSASG